MDELENAEALDYETVQEQRYDELSALLDSHNMRALKQRMEELNEFDVAEFLSEIKIIRCVCRRKRLNDFLHDVICI